MSNHEYKSNSCENTENVQIDNFENVGIEESEKVPSEREYNSESILYDLKPCHVVLTKTDSIRKQLKEKSANFDSEFSCNKSSSSSELHHNKHISSRTRNSGKKQYLKSKDSKLKKSYKYDKSFYAAVEDWTSSSDWSCSDDEDWAKANKIYIYTMECKRHKIRNCTEEQCLSSMNSKLKKKPNKYFRSYFTSDDKEDWTKADKINKILIRYHKICK